MKIQVYGATMHHVIEEANKMGVHGYRICMDSHPTMLNGVWSVWMERYDNVTFDAPIVTW